MADEDVFMLNKSFSEFSAGTQFTILTEEGGYIARCETRYPVGDRGYLRADIPLDLLTRKRNLAKQGVSNEEV